MQYRHLIVRPAALAPIRQALGGEGHSRGALLAVFGASSRPAPGADRCSPASHRVGCSAAELEFNIRLRARRSIPSCGRMNQKPVTLPPGRARLATALD